MKKFLLENGRPDKPVACPRCYSLNTKFCYFNNYNVKQPRHFCRECQRYWTAGGSLRNVPVGAGRRKHKMSSSNPSNLYGKAPTISICSETDECAHVSSFKPYISSHLAACSPDGKNVQEKRHADLMPVHGSEKSRFSQSMQKLAMDKDFDSKFSMTTHGDRPDTSTLTSTRYDAGDTEKLGSPQMSQKRLRELTFDQMICKMTHGHGPGTPKWTSTIVQAQENGHDNVQDHVDDDAQDDVDDCAHCDVQGDSHDTGAPEVLPSHDDDVHKKRLSHCGVTHNMLASCQMAEHDDSTCCSSVTAALTSSSEAASEPNGSSPTTHTVLSVAAKPLGLDSTSAFWGPLMWPWLWPFCLNGANSAPAGGGISQVESTLATNLGAATPNVFKSTIGAMATSNTSHIDPAHESATGPGFLPWPYVWSPLAWGSPWNMAWNAANITSMGIKHSHGPAQEKQGSICIPKTLRLNHPDEAAHSSILSTLGVTSPSHSTAGFFNAFQPRGDVFRPKATAQQAHIEHLELPQHSSTHVNPAAQARSIAFQEGS